MSRLRATWDGSDVRLTPTGPLTGTVRPPGSKSLTNRFLTCAALADGRTILRHASLSDDVLRMIGGLRALGINIDTQSRIERLIVDGCRGHIPATRVDIDAGHAGTAMRFLTALAAVGHGQYRLDGSPRMRQRPIGPLLGALQELGAVAVCDGNPGCPPITLMARGLTGGAVRFVAPPSSQFLSALLMVAPYAQNDVYIAVDGGLPSGPYVEMTTRAMGMLGVDVLSADGDRFVIPAGQRYRGRELEVEPDASAATYFWAAAAITGGRICITGLTRESLQGDVHFVEALERMGAVVEEHDAGLCVAGRPARPLRGITIDLNRMPDTVQTLAVTALFAEGSTEIRNVANLRVKETDRIAALASELSKLGAGVTVFEDGLRIDPPAEIRSAAIETFDDHRMAMSFTLAGLVADGVVIRDGQCVSKSFPAFFEVLNEIE